MGLLRFQPAEPVHSHRLAFSQQELEPATLGMLGLRVLSFREEGSALWSHINQGAPSNS
ncbi:hypothetical protein HispidOSU_029421, partial [Sigmodon hispidus]